MAKKSQTCIKCGVPLDECNPNCRRCRNRAATRRYMAKKRGEYVETPKRGRPKAQPPATADQVRTLNAYNDWLTARQQRIAKTPPRRYADPPPAQKLLTEAQAAEATGYSRNTVTCARLRGDIHPDEQATDNIGRIVYRAAEVMRWAETARKLNRHKKEKK